jgi:2-oxoisovalerate dehydrogenase E1 component
VTRIIETIPEPAESSLVSIPGIERDPFGKPLLPVEAETLYRFGHLVRLVEQLLLELFSKGLLSGTTHTCLGQELCQMAVVRALDHADDVVLSNHRNHGHFLTYSGDFVGLVAEIMGRRNGVCRGVGGSQHLASRHFHSNGVQAGMTAIGAGVALARKLVDSPAIVTCIVGDGTMGEGLLYESLNLASIWNEPMLFVVERNGIAQTTSTADTVGGSIEKRGEAFGLATWQLDDADPRFMDDVDEIVKTVRSSRAPGFLVIDTRRLGPHSKGDDLRPGSELDAIRARDPLTKLGALLDPHMRRTIDQTNAAYIERVRDAAMASPEARFADTPADVRDGEAVQLRGPSANSRNAKSEHSAKAFAERQSPPITNRQSLNRALGQLLDERPDVILLGQDLHDPYGGAFKVTKGLSSAYPGRVISTPISEAGVVGAGIGLALAGYLPIVEMMFADFISLAMDQLFNHAVKFGPMFEGLQVPLVVRTPSGGRRGYGPTHSQSTEGLVSAIPGLTVVFASHRHDAGAVLRTATLEWPHPTVCFEHKLLYGEQQDRGDYVVAAAAADPAAWLFPTLVRKRNDADLTVVAYGGALPGVERAVRMLEGEDLGVEIVSPCLLHPLPRQTLGDLLMGSARVAVVEEAPLGTGFGAELAATLLESGFRGKLKRFAPPPVPIPAARSLEAQVLPNETRLFEQLASYAMDTERA